jgi:hypothetical protein
MQQRAERGVVRAVCCQWVGAEFEGVRGGHG